MYGVLAAESAILVHFKPIRRVFFVFRSVVVSLLAFVASECYFDSHFGASFLASLFDIDRSVHLLCLAIFAV